MRSPRTATKSSPCSPQLEKARAQQRKTQRSQSINQSNLLKKRINEYKYVYNVVPSQKDLNWPNAFPPLPSLPYKFFRVQICWDFIAMLLSFTGTGHVTCVFWAQRVVRVPRIPRVFLVKIGLLLAPVFAHYTVSPLHTNEFHSESTFVSPTCL